MAFSRKFAAPSAEEITAKASPGCQAPGQRRREGEGELAPTGATTRLACAAAGALGRCSASVTKCPSTRNLGCLPALIVARKWERDERKGGVERMRALLCHCRTHLEAKDDAALAEEVREHLLRDHAAPRPTDEHVWEIVHTRAYDFEVYDPQYAEVSLD